MSLDIRTGDMLVYNGVDYPIKSVLVFEDRGVTPAMRRMTRQTVSVKRLSMTAGVSSGYTDHLSGIRSSRLDPVDGETRERLRIETPHTIKQAFLVDADSYARVFVEVLPL